MNNKNLTKLVFFFFAPCLGMTRFQLAKSRGRTFSMETQCQLIIELEPWPVPVPACNVPFLFLLHRKKRERRDKLLCIAFPFYEDPST